MTRDARMTSAFYPFIIRTRTAVGRDAGAIFALGHGLGAVLLRERDGVGRVVRRDELEALGLDPYDAYLRATRGLDHLFASRMLPYAMHELPDGQSCVVFSHRLLGASCIVLPGVYELASGLLGCESLCLAVPRRDALVIFADHGASSRSEIRRQVLERLASGHVELTRELFAVDATGPSLKPLPSARSSHLDIEVDLDAEDAA